MPGGHCISNIYSRSFPNPSSWPWPSEVETGNLTWLVETESSEKHVKHKKSGVSTFWEDVWEWSCWSCVNYTLQFQETTTPLPKWAGYILPALTRGIKSLMTAFIPTPDTAGLFRVKSFCGVFGFYFSTPHPITELLNAFWTVLPLDVAAVQSSVICSPLAELLACYWAGRVI